MTINKKLKWAIIAFLLIAALISCISPYFLLVMRGALLHGERNGTITKESAMEQIEQEFPIKAPQGWRINRDTMDSVYGWLHALDCKIRYDYWHATSIEDAMENHTSFNGSTWN